MWVSGLVSAGAGIATGHFGGKNARKLKARRQPYLEQLDRRGSQLLSDMGRATGQKQRLLDRGYQKINEKVAKAGYADKVQAVTAQRKAVGRATQQGIDTGLINSSVFQGARRGITAETSALLASISERVSAVRAGLDEQKMRGDLALADERADTQVLKHDLGMASDDRWLMHQTGAGIGGMTQGKGGGMDFSGIGNVAKYLFKGAGGESSSLIDWLF